MTKQEEFDSLSKSDQLAFIDAEIEKCRSSRAYLYNNYFRPLNGRIWTDQEIEDMEKYAEQYNLKRRKSL